MAQRNGYDDDDRRSGRRDGESGPERMDEMTFGGVIKGLLQDAEDYAEELGDLREQTTAAYNGDGYGNEVEGRSQIVTREVRDAVESAKPQIMRTLFGSQSIVEYAGRTPDDVQTARDATAYAKYAVMGANRGYMEFLSAVEDALIRKTGILKVWWEENETPVKTNYQGLTSEGLELLAADDDVSEVVATPSGERYPAEIPEGAEPGSVPPVELFDAEVTRIESGGELRFEAVPPEELVIHRKARSLQDARIVGHQRTVTLSDLMVMGYDWDEIEDLGGGDPTDQELEEEARSVGSTTSEIDDGEGDPSQAEVLYTECWVKVDYDGDGIAELRRVCVAGDGYKILHNELAEYVPMADICPSPVAHQAIGRSLGELVEDIQKLKSMMMRNTLDSLANSIHPDTEAVEGQVDFDDLMNPEVGRIIRVKQPGMLRYLNVPFIGREVFPIMQYLDTLAESRTGMNEAAEGLNADALQSTSSQAIDNATRSAQSRIEFIARTFVEGGIKDFYKLVYRLAHENIDRKSWVRLNRRFLQVDPRTWTMALDVTTTVALGEGSLEQRLQVLRELAAKQEQIIQTAGPDNPLAGIEEYRNTLARIVELSGIVDVERYLKDPTDPASQPAPKPDPGPTPEEMLAQAEVQKAANEAERNRRQFELDVWEARQKDDRERDKLLADTMLRAEKLRQDGAKVDIDAIKTALERRRDDAGILDKLMQARNAADAAQSQSPGSQGAPTGSGPANGGTQ